MNRRIVFGMLSLALGCVGVGCGSSGGGTASGTGGSTGQTGSGGTSGTSSGGQTGTGSGGATQTGSGGTTQPGTGGKGPGGMTQPGTGGRATTGSGGGGGTKGSGGTGTTGSGGSAMTGSGGNAGSGAGGSNAGGGTGTGGTASGGTVGTADQNVLERNKNPSRDGMFIQPSLTKAAVAMMTADTAFNTAATFTSTVTNGANVAASPLYLDAPSGGLFFIPTVGGDVVARKEDGTSAWSTSIGAPATGSIGCSNPTTPPLGILSTPVIDAQSKTIYVAGIVGSGSGVTGQIASAIDITTGMVKSGWPVNVHTLASFDPKIHNQRSALSLVNGILYIPYAGYVGDCGSYHGRVVAIDTSDPTKAGQWMTGDAGDGIWASGGMAADGNNIYVATGNAVPLGSAPATHSDSEEIVRLTGMGTKADYFYPSDWASLDKSDADVGAANPVVVTVPGATPSKLVVAFAKSGSGYVLDAAQLRGSTSTSGMGGELASFSLASGSGMSIYGAPAAYTTAMGTYVVMSSSSAMGCPGAGGTGRQLMAVKISPSPLKASVAWCAPMGSATNAIATTTDGKSDAVVWFANSGKLVGVDGDTGANLYTSSNSCASVPKWSSPIAVKGRIVVAGNGRLCAWGLPGATTQAQ